MLKNTAYDLLVLIDADVPEDRRSAVLEGIKKQIAGGDAVLRGDVDWGVRRLAYEIEHRPEAYYHLFQLEARPELLGQLEHALAIDDAVLRHRFIRLPRGAPDTPPRPAPRHPTPQEQGERSPRAPEPREPQEQGERSPRPPEPQEQAEPAAAPVQEQADST